MYNEGFPVANIAWSADNSGASSDVLYSANSDGLCVPFSFIMAERGAPGEIYFGGAAELQPILGSATFDERSIYYTPATRFAGTAMAAQGVEVMRLVDPAATVARLGIFATKVAASVTQYQKTVDGIVITDVNGDPLPMLDVGGDPVVEPGVKITWSVRALTSQEVFDDLDIVVTGTGNTQTTTYPIFGLEVDSQGLYGNRQGLRLYSTGGVATAIAEDISSVLYRFEPVALPTSVSTTARSIPDRLGGLYNDFSFKDVAVYGGTATNYALKYILRNSYTSATSGGNLLPYTLYPYGANISALGAAVLAVSPELGDIDPYLIDLISGEDLSGSKYDHLEVDEASALVVSSDVINYAVGGTDGEVSFTKLQELIIDWCEGSDHGEFGNLQQHPMTHFSDPGFAMDTKYAVLNLLDLRDNLRIDLACQDVSLPLNTKAQDLSAGQALVTRARLHPNSTIAGIGCSRVSVWAHAGELVNGTAYTGMVPFNLNRLIQRRNLDGGQILKGSSGGQPNSNVTMFLKANWVADDIAARSSAWASGINTVMHADRTTIFYPALRTVYPNDTSLLSDDEFSDAVTYIFKICRRVWAIYAGAKGKKSKMFDRIQREMKNQCDIAMGATNVVVTPTVGQTAADANLGYAYRVSVQISGDPTLRVGNFDIILERTVDDTAAITI